MSHLGHTHANWADDFIAGLKAGQTVQFRPHGHSMTGRIESGQLCTLEPAVAIAVDDVVLCSVQGVECLHLVKSIEQGRYLIGDNQGNLNGWIGPEQIYGRLLTTAP